MTGRQQAVISLEWLFRLGRRPWLAELAAGSAIGVVRSATRGCTRPFAPGTLTFAKLGRDAWMARRPTWRN